VHPDPSQVVNNPQTGNNINMNQLGDWNTPGSFMGVFNAQVLNNGGSPKVGSIENEIEISKSVGGTGFPATAIRLYDMYMSRDDVGAVISPIFK
jgi:hypothetical protein